MVDMLCQVPRLPRSGEGIVVEESRAVVGGCAFNAANVLRQLGAPYELFAPVGCGIFAGFVERELRERGLERRGWMIATAAAACASWSRRPAHDGHAAGHQRHFRARMVRPCRGRALRLRVRERLRGGRAGRRRHHLVLREDHPSIELYYAPGPRVCGVGAQKTARINALHPVWHLNDQEALAYTGSATLEEAGAAIVEECGNAVVITAGKDGAHLFVDGRHAVISAGLVDVVDTVGAGDAHLGALTAARAAGRSWEDALALANRVAGAVCGVEGSTLADEAFARTGARL